MSKSDERTGRVLSERTVIRDGRVVEADSPEAAARAEEQIARARARQERRREVWGADNTEQIVRLACTFPTLRDADGLEPWETARFLVWASGPSCTSGGWHAAMFVLSVWNSVTDWATVARDEGLLSVPRRVSNRASVAVELGLTASDDAECEVLPEVVDRAAAAVHATREFTFRPVLAFGVWDEAHRDAFLAWCQLPFFP